MGWLDNYYPWTNLHELNLDWIIELAKEVQNTVKGFPAQIQNLQTQINSVNTELANIKSQLNTLQNRKWDWSNEIAQSLIDANSYTNSQIKFLETEFALKLNELKILLSQYVSELQQLVVSTSLSDREYTDSQIALLKIWAESIPLPAIINPLTGQLEGIDKVLKDLFYYAKVNSLTAGEYDNMKLTAEEYDGYGLTAYQYDFAAKAYLKPSTKIGEIINPFTGEYDSIQNVVDTLAGYHKDGNTAKEYDNLDFTALEYDNLNKTAYQFDMQPIMMI